MLCTILLKVSISKLFKIDLLGMMYVGIIFSFESFPITTNYFGGPTWNYFSLVVGSLLIIGIFNIILNIPINIYFQKMVPTNIRSRVFS